MSGILLAGSSYPLTFSDADLQAQYIQVEKIIPNDGVASGLFGYSVAASGNTVVVGSPGHNSNGGNSGSVYIFEKEKTGNYSVSFSGTTDLLTTGSNSNFAFGTGDFTIEGWLRLATGENRGIFQIGPNVGGLYPVIGNTIALAIDAATGNPWQLYWAGSFTQGADAASLVGSWVHFAVVRTQGTSKLYINGVESAARIDTYNYTCSYLAIGGYYSSSYLFKGHISNFRIIKGIALYTSNFTPQTTPLTPILNTALITCQTSTIADTGGNNILINVNGTPAVTASQTPFSSGAYIELLALIKKITPDDGVTNDKFGSSVSLYKNILVVGSPFDDGKGSAYVYEKIISQNNSVYFSGANQYLTVPSNAAHNFGSTPFTIECWFNCANGSSPRGLFGNYQFSSNQGWRVIVNVNKVSYWQRDGGEAYSNVSFTNNTWNHVAIVGNGTTIKLYLNGIAGAVTAVQSAAVTSGGYFSIGKNSDDSSGITWPFNGYISNVRIVKGTAVYTSNFTVPTQPLTAVTNTVLLTCNSDPIKDNSVNDLLVTSVNGAAYNNTGPFINPFTGWLQKQKLTANDGVAGDQFGYSVCNTSEFVFVSSPYSDTSGVDSGSVYTFTASSGVWQQTQKLTSNDLSAGDNFGLTVTINNQNILTIGSPGDDDLGSNSGSVYVFEKGVTQWTQSQKLIASDGVASANFGSSLSMDTDTLLIGAPNDNDAGVGSGSAYLFEKFNNGSVYFDGSGDYLTVADSSNLELGGNNFTIEAWIYLTTLTGIQAILGKWGPAAYPFLFHIINGNLTFAVNNSYYPNNTNGTLTANVWTHVALVRLGNTWTIYANGSQIFTGSNSIIVNNDTTPWNIGRNPDAGGTFYFNGYITNLRIVIGTALYTSNFTPSSTPLAAINGTSLLVCKSLAVEDESNNKFTVNRFGNSSLSTITPFNQKYKLLEKIVSDDLASSDNFGTSVVTLNNILAVSSPLEDTKGIDSGSVYIFESKRYYSTHFPNQVIGINDSLTLPNSREFQIASNVDFTVELYLYLSSAVSDYSYIFAISDGANIVQFRIGNSGFGYRIQAVFGPGASINSVYDNGDYTQTYLLNKWTHLALSRVGTTVRFFLDGQEIAAKTSVGSITLGSPTYVYINYASPYGVSGYISNLRYVIGNGLYAANFSPSKKPLTSITGTVLLTCQNSVIVDNSPNNFTITKNGQSGISTFNPFVTITSPVNYYSNYFDGNGDYLTVANETAFNFGSSSFTIEFWFNSKNIGTQWIVSRFSGPTGSDANSSFAFLFTSGNKIQFSFAYNASSAQSFLVSATALQVDTWYHVAAVRNGTVIELYLNGVKEATTSVIGSMILNDSTLNINIGQRDGGSNYYYGNISNLRIVVGSAVYTSNFTPSSEPLTAISGTILLTCQTDSITDNSPNIKVISKFGNTSVSSLIPFIIPKGTSSYIRQFQKLTANDGLANDKYGTSLTMLGSSTLIIGAPYDDGTSADSGSVYVANQN